MRWYMDILTGRTAKMTVNDDKSVVFEGVWYPSDEDALKADMTKLWMQSGYEDEAV